MRSIGPYHEKSICGFQYFLTIVDDHSHATWGFLLKHKDEVAQTLKHLLAMVERQFNTKVKIVRSDNEKEFTSLTN